MRNFLGSQVTSRRLLDFCPKMGTRWQDITNLIYGISSNLAWPNLGLHLALSLSCLFWEGTLFQSGYRRYLQHMDFSAPVLSLGMQADPYCTVCKDDNARCNLGFRTIHIIAPRS